MHKNDEKLQGLKVFPRAATDYVWQLKRAPFSPLFSPLTNIGKSLNCDYSKKAVLENFYILVFENPYSLEEACTGPDCVTKGLTYFEFLILKCQTLHCKNYTRSLVAARCTLRVLSSTERIEIQLKHQCNQSSNHSRFITKL